MLLLSCGCDSTPSGPTDKAGNATDLTASNVSTTDSSKSYAESKIRFEDVALKAEIDFTARTGQESQLYTILESLGSGIAFCDYDGDSQPDLAAPGGGVFDPSGFPVGQPFGLFRQTQGNRFQSTASLANIPDPSFYSHGIAVADWDNDGFCDFLITGFHGRLMLHNEGDGTFSRELCGMPA